MAYEYDRFEREEGSGAFLMGLLAGTVLGAGLGMLFAPRPGSELRSQLSDQAGKLRNTASDAYQQVSEKVTQFAERGKEMYDRRSPTGTTGDVTSGATGTTGSDLGGSGNIGSPGGDFGTTGGSGTYGGSSGNSGL